MVEYRKTKNTGFKLISNGLAGGFLLTFFVYMVFMPANINQYLLKHYAILFLIFSGILTFVASRIISQIISGTINRKGEALRIKLAFDTKKLCYETQVLRYDLLVKDFEKLIESENFFHLLWSAEKAHYLREIGLMSIPKRAMNEAQKFELKNIFKSLAQQAELV